MRKRPSKPQSPSAQGKPQRPKRPGQSPGPVAAPSRAVSVSGASPMQSLPKNSASGGKATSFSIKKAVPLPKSSLLRAGGPIKTTLKQVASTPLAVSVKQNPVAGYSSRQHDENRSLSKSRALEKGAQDQKRKDDACTPSPDPVRSGGGSGMPRTYVNWKSRKDLPCKR